MENNELKQESQDIAVQANNYNVSCTEDLKKAAYLISSIKLVEKKIKDFFEPTIDQFKKAKNAADKGRKDTIDKMNVYLSPAENARKLITQKCRKYEDDLEKERLAEQERKKAEMLKKAEEERAWGDEEKAKDIEFEADVHIEEKVEKVTGLCIRRTWKAKVIDKSKIPLDYLEPNMQKLNAMARIDKDKFNIPGCESFED